MKKLIKNVLIIGVATTLGVATVYGESYKENKEIKNVNLKAIIESKKNVTTSETNTKQDNTKQDNTKEVIINESLYAGLNTNADDIRNLSFYKTELSSDENTVNIAENMFKKVELTQLDEPKKGDVVAVIETSEGTIKVKLLPEVAPKAVKNFVEHSLNGYYDGLTFHRVIDNFVAQGGDPTGTGMGGESIWGKNFANEVNSSARHFSGALAMANSGGTATNGSQFYFVDNLDLPVSQVQELSYLKEHQDEVLEHLHEPIEGEENVYHEGDISVKDMFSPEVIDAYKTVGGTPFLDFGYTVFGQTYDGLDVVDKITQVEVDRSDKPVNPVIIKKITIGIVE